MEKAKEILRLSIEMGLSQRDVADGAGCSVGLVNTVLSRVKAAGVSDPRTLTSKQLGTILYPPLKGENKKSEPDLEYIDKEMKKKGVTLYLLWERYKLENPDGLMYTQFCVRYRTYRKINSVYMRKVYKAGEQIMVDWAGLTMKYMEGKVERDAYVFVAILPASSYLYVEVFRDMTQQSWIGAHVNAFEYFGGTTKLLVPDNAKTAVIKAKYYDPELNKTYHEMAIHYRSAIVPTRSCKPKDKAPVENGVLITERKIIAPLSYKTFLTFNELHDAVRNELEVLNNTPFQKQNGCRRSLFLETEKSELQALPVNRYEYATWKTAKVNFDYHVCYDKNQFYSVPYQHVGKTVRIRATSRIIEVFLEGERVACHIRNYNAYQHYTTDVLHMPEKHKVMTDWTPERFLIWAGKTGEHTREYIQYLLQHKRTTTAGIQNMRGNTQAGYKCFKRIDGTNL